ncbi:hypothetical protein Ancab_032942 [Ancistrocladus abbreviatus]
MEFIEDEARPRFLFQSRPLSSSAAEPQNEQHINKLIALISLSLALLFLLSFFFFPQPEPFQSLLIWFSLSLIIGPFAPLSLTAGDIRVGQGRIVEFPPQDEAISSDESKKKPPTKRQKGKRSDEIGLISNGSVSSRLEVQKVEDLEHNSTDYVNGSLDFDKRKEGFKENDDRSAIEEREWTEEDLELLRKQALKHPVGKPRRWEVIAEAFKGRYSVQSVIKMAKSMGDAKPEDSDSYSMFLRNRKPVDKRIIETGDGESGDGGDRKTESGNANEVSSWSSSEDIALLNALKAFPKDVSMRWEKIAASVPGKSKAACMKRVSDLKRDFRSSKAASDSRI